jgi:catechol 2,3-dioxygenase-like lactoylglutathione lyase family enzyme
MYIERLELIAPDVPALAAFYGTTLGLPVVDHCGKSAEIVAGASRLVFRSEAIAGAGRYHIAFNIPENLLSEAMAWLKQRVILIADPAHGEIFNFTDWNAHAVYFYDPMGNVLEFIARHDLPNHAPGPFSPELIECVSEIGVGAASVLDTVEELRKATGCELYRPGNERFAPVGDEHGLFIVVPRGREWFPNTGITEENLPLKVVLRREPGSLPIELSFAIGTANHGVERGKLLATMECPITPPPLTPSLD